ncbi:MAG: hypothetical protein ACKVWV_06755 [Planctomycetota bacterium]
MSDELEYLWDKSGTPDPAIERLERDLARYRYPVGPAVRGDESVVRPHSSPPRTWPRAAWISAAAAAALALVWITAPYWRGATAGYRVTGVDGTTLVRAGDALATGSAGRAQLAIAGLGHVDVEPSTRLRVEDCGVDAHRLYLERGTLRAKIFAGPRQFQIGTPAGLTVDLGCEYTLDVDDAGRSILRVHGGQVAFEFEGRSVYVPAGASSIAQPGIGPSIPVFEDASAEFRQALIAVDFGARYDDPGAADALFDTRREDTLTLWHLFDAPGTDPALRERCYQRLSIVFPKPSDATEAGLFAGNRAMRDAWMDVMKPSWKVE